MPTMSPSARASRGLAATCSKDSAAQDFLKSVEAVALGRSFFGLCGLETASSWSGVRCSHVRSLGDALLDAAATTTRGTQRSRQILLGNYPLTLRGQML